MIALEPGTQYKARVLNKIPAAMSMSDWAKGSKAHWQGVREQGHLWTVWEKHFG